MHVGVHVLFLTSEKHVLREKPKVSYHPLWYIWRGMMVGVGKSQLLTNYVKKIDV